MSDQRTEFYKLFRELEGRVAKQSPFYMAKYIMGRGLFVHDRAVGWSQAHLELSALMWGLYRLRHDRKAGTILKVEWCRGSRKSTLGGALIVCVLLDDPNFRWLLESDTELNASKKLQPIKATFEDEYFKWLYGDRRGRVWKADELEVIRTAKLSDPSVYTTGIGTEKTSQHYDGMMPDDLQTEGNANTLEQVEKVRSGFRLYESLGVGSYFLVNMGTRWAFSDLGAMIDEIAADDSRQGRQQRIFIDKRPAYKQGPKGEFIYTEPNFPETLPLEVLRVKRQSEGAELFSYNYLLEPLSDETAIFKRQNLQYHEKGVKDLPGAHFYLAVDPAGSGGFNGADFNAFVVCAVTEYAELYVMEAVAKHCTEQGILDEIIRMARQYPLRGVMVEKRFKQHQLAAWLKKESYKTPVPIPWKEFKQDDRSKQQRIKALRPYFESNKVFLRRSMVDLEDQVLKFPRLEHDDLLDAWAFILDMMFVPQSHEKGDWWLRDDWKTQFEPTIKQPTLPSDNDVRTWRFKRMASEHKAHRQTVLPLSRGMK